MRLPSFQRASLVFAVLCFSITGSFGDLALKHARGESKLEYNRDIRPILADNCFACHGPDGSRREAGLRLDQRANAIAASESGATAIVPGKSTDSELVARITSGDEDLRMPPVAGNKKLTEQQIELLKRWVDEGAEYQDHWSFRPIDKPTPPPAERAVNSVDQFVLAHLQQKQVQPASQADAITLARRVAFDLTGLPPTSQQVASLAADPSMANYERLVDELLASPRYGERLTMWWLDLVRYADTVGYHGDQPVTMYLFRDWVIGAFNANMPFDQFTREQLGGDLLPNPTKDQKIAASYNRLGMMTAEGGAQDKEYLAKYAAERVRNIGGAWLGITVGCCECHDHKFDPITLKDFYQLEAFFADIEEYGVYAGESFRPKLSFPTPEQERLLVEKNAAFALVDAEWRQASKVINQIPADWEASVGDEKRHFPKPIKEILETPDHARTKKQQEQLLNFYRTVAPETIEIRDVWNARRAERDDVANSIVQMLTTVAVKPRTIRVLPRGNWMDDSGEIVEPAAPGFLPQPPAKEGRMSRLDLANWLVSRENPLTARTLVNRLWALYFGAGLSRKLDDLGAQGEWPSHPELLDWLAADLIDNGWNLKRTIKQIVMSDTYRQSSLVTPAMKELDPFNRLLARQGRFRLDAEMVRDNALYISGLLVERLGGPSVKPYQPPGYWAYLNFPEREWHNDSGGDLYRRGLYTHWQRQYLHPSLLAFDAPSREECTAERIRSNTPLQSLVMLNDPSYVEAARVFAELIMRSAGSTPQERLEYAFQRALSRSIRPAEAEVLVPLYEQHLAQYKQDATAANQALSVGASAQASDLDRAELAAWTSIARAILNLHATITRS